MKLLRSWYIFKMGKSVYIYTYGCQMNVHDSEKMRGLLVQDGFEVARRPEEADLIVFNTCAIREKAEQKFYSQLGRTKFIKRRRSGVKIAVSGCVAQECGRGIFKRAPFVDFVLGPQNIPHIAKMVSGSPGSVYVDDAYDITTEELFPDRDSSLKAWVSIMYGCNNFCSYCIVPYTRGREVSRPSGSIVSEVSALKEKGYREVTLLGQNVNSYRSDTDFTGLLRRIDATGIPRIRFVTSHPRDLSDDLIAAMADLPRVCEHLHLPLQSGADRILGLMNRGYSYREYARRVELLRKTIPGIAITTDIIVGFPGETDKEHDSTVRSLQEMEFDGMFAFKYSPRKGTKASTMDGQVPDEVKSERLTELLLMQEDITRAINRRLEGTLQEVLVEGLAEADAGLMTGRTRSNKIVNFESSPEVVGSLAMIRIERTMTHSLWGSKADSE